MNQSEVIALLHNIVAANQKYTTWTVSTPHLVMLANKAIEDEREAIAKMVEGLFGDPNDPVLVFIVDAIRARGNT